MRPVRLVVLLVLCAGLVVAPLVTQMQGDEFVLLAYLAASLAISWSWGHWWLGPLCCVSGMLLFQVSTGWSPFRPGSESVFCWGTIVVALLVGSLGSALGMLVARVRRPAPGASRGQHSLRK